MKMRHVRLFLITLTLLLAIGANASPVNIFDVHSILLYTSESTQTPIDSIPKGELDNVSVLLEDHIEAGNYSQAEALIAKATDQFLAALSSPSKAKYALVAADVYHYQGKYTLAEEYFERSRKKSCQ